MPKQVPMYYCEPCDFTSSKKSNYEVHITTAKHKKITNDDSNQSIKSHICQCGKEFKYRQGLSRHRKNCTHHSTQESTDTDKDDKYDMLSSTIMMLVNENREFKQLLVEQNAKMMEMAGNMGGNNHHNNNTNTNSHNKFNLNVFLNEQCKDAISIQTFIENLDIGIKELEHMGNVGYLQGMMTIMSNTLGAMDVYKRPVHCTDLKRETVYIKDGDTWKKDNANNDDLRRVITVSYTHLTLPTN